MVFAAFLATVVGVIVARLVLVGFAGKTVWDYRFAGKTVWDYLVDVFLVPVAVAVDFFNVGCWRELAETVANHKKKGDPILVEGRLKYRTWQALDGTKRSAVEVVADRVRFLSRGQNPQPEKNPQAAEVVGALAKVRAGRTAAAARGVGGWGPAMKQLHDDGADDTDLEEEGFQDIPF